VALVPFLDFGASRGRPRRLLNLLAIVAVISFIVMTAWGLLPPETLKRWGVPQ